MNVKEQQKLLYLQRILNLYVKFLRAYSDVTVEVVTRRKGLENIYQTVRIPYTDKTEEVHIGVKEVKFSPAPFVKITYFGTRFDFYNHQTIEFPLSHLSKRIQHYRKKLFTAFRNRHGKQNV